MPVFVNHFPPLSPKLDKKRKCDIVIWLTITPNEGDPMRKDGRLIKTMDPMYQVAMHIMAKRNDALNMIEIDIPMEPIQKYLNEKRKQGHALSHLTVVLATYVRAIAEFPELNRFVVNKRLYARNEITVGMVVLKPGEHDGTMNKMFFKPTDTIFDVQKTLDDYVEQNRRTGETNSTDKMISALLSIPGLCRIGVPLFKLADRWGLLPKSVIDLSPFHCSMTITNLGSIRTNFIYHHVYNFGTTTSVMAMGNAKEVPVRKGETVEFVRCTPIGVVMDERVCSGSYYASAFRYMEKFFKNPALLEVPPETVKEDIP